MKQRHLHVHFDRSPLLVGVTLLSSLLGGAVHGAEPAIAQFAPGEASVTDLCVAHGRNCDCPGCRAYYRACEVPSEPGAVVTPSGPVENSEGVAAPEGEEAPIAEQEQLTGPMPSVTSSFGAVAASTSATPNMIGDSPNGGCGGLAIDGALVATVDHPLYACSRLNIAENNSALVRDRFYFTYRHFDNASKLDIFSYAPTGGASSFDIEQYTFAGEKRVLGDWTSLEFRLPITHQLDSDLYFEQLEFGNNLAGVFATGTTTDIGNCSAILKHVLRQSRTVTVSAGVGVNIPTAPDFSLTARIDSPDFEVFDPDLTRAENEAAGPIATPEVDITAVGSYNNETVNLQPFLAYQWRPGDLFFSNGFLQFDVPMNAASGQFSVTGTYDGDAVNVAEAGTLRQQMLVRGNLGGGMWLTGPRVPCNRSLASALMFEMHYTGTLDRPDRQTVTIAVPGDDIDLVLGPLADSTNSLNAVMGLPVFFGPWAVYNGIGVPLRDGMDRGYDFEYSMSVQRLF